MAVNVTDEFLNSTISIEAEQRSADAVRSLGLSSEDEEKFLANLSNGRASDEEEQAYAASMRTRSTLSSALSFTDSPLVKYTCLSPNCNYNRGRAIDTITIHEVWGECSMKLLGDIFLPVSRQASSNYGVCEDGIALFVHERDRAWTSGSTQDYRAVTIETSNSRTYPNAVNAATYDRLIQLCADICRRNGKTKMVWCGSLAATNARHFEPWEMRMTVHCWFQSTGCPGPWLLDHMQDIANKVNAMLMPIYPKVPFAVKVLIDDLTIRKGAGKTTKALGYAPKGNVIIDEVRNDWGYIKDKGWIYLGNNAYTKIGGHIEVSPFKDVKITDSSYKYIKEVYEAGLMKGYSNGKFYPKRKVTRQQLATVVAKLLDKK